MKAARTSETSVDNYFTRQYIPEDDSELHTRRRENLKSHKFIDHISKYQLLKKIVFFRNSDLNFGFDLCVDNYEKPMQKGIYIPTSQASTNVLWESSHQVRKSDTWYLRLAEMFPLLSI
jgi:hypothetical protein